MPGTRWITVDATIVECFRAWGEPLTTPRPWFEVVADIETGADGAERVTFHQRLNTLTHHWRSPDPGDVVRAKWDPAHHALRLDLGGDLRYDERLIRAIGRTREAPSWPPIGLPGRR